MERQGSRRNRMKTALSRFGAADAPANGQCGSPSARYVRGARIGQLPCAAFQWSPGQAAGIRADERHARRCSSSPVSGAIRSPALSGSKCDTPEGCAAFSAPPHGPQEVTALPEGTGNAIAPCPYDRTGLGPQGRSHGTTGAGRREERPSRAFGYTGVSPQMVTRCMIRVCVG